MDDNQSDFVQLLTSVQPRLFGYISMLLGGTQDASNVLQETNLVLWKKASDYQPDTNFFAWSRKIAYYKTLSHLRDRKRSKLLLSQERIEKALAQSPASEDEDERRIALRHCLGELSEDLLELLKMRYTSEVPLVHIASRLGKTEGAVKMALRRVRLCLMACIQQQTGGTDA